MSLVGVYGLSLLILVVNYALGLGALALFDRRWCLEGDEWLVSEALAGRWLYAVRIVLVVWVGVSLALTHYGTGRTPHVRVAAIHPAFKIKPTMACRSSTP